MSSVDEEQMNRSLVNSEGGDTAGSDSSSDNEKANQSGNGGVANSIEMAEQGTSEGNIRTGESKTNDDANPLSSNASGKKDNTLTQTVSNASQNGDKESEEKNKEIGNEKMTEALILEKTTDTIVAKITGFSTWAGASLTGSAVGATIEYLTDNKATGTLYSWVYTLVCFLLAWALTLVEQSFDKPRELAKELEIEVPSRQEYLEHWGQQKMNNEDITKTSDAFEAAQDKERIKQNRKRAEHIKLRKAAKRREQAKREEALAGDHGMIPQAKAAAWKVANFVEVETEAFSEVFINLLVGTMANVTAVALSNAMAISIGNISGAGTAILSALLYACFVTYVAVVVTLESGRHIEKLEDETYALLKETNFDYGRLKPVLLKFAAKKRALDLLTKGLTFTIGLAWRAVSKLALELLFNTQVTGVTSAWVYLLQACLIFALANTIFKRYAMFIPKQKGYAFQLKSKERELVGKTYYGSVNFMIGLSYADAIKLTLTAIFGAAGSAAGMWAAAVILMLVSVATTQAWERFQFNLAADVNGVVNAVYEMFPNFKDPKQLAQAEVEEQLIVAQDSLGQETNEGIHIPILDSYESSFIKDYIVTFVDVNLATYNIAAGILVSNAVTTTVGLITKGKYDPDNFDNKGEDVRGEFVTGIWISTLMSYLIWSAVVGYLARLLNAAREARRVAFEELAEEVEEVEQEIQQLIEFFEVEEDQNNDGDGTKKEQ